MLVIWQAVLAIAVTTQITTHGDLGLIAVFVLPAFYYLAVPTAFRTKVGVGVLTSALLWLVHAAGAGFHLEKAGVVIVLALLSAALAVTAMRSGRLHRLEWAAARAHERTAEQLADSPAMLDGRSRRCRSPLS